MQNPKLTAIQSVIAERQRQQTVEGFTPEHDDANGLTEGAGLAIAAACYCIYSASVKMGSYGITIALLLWPWDRSWWKPKSPREDLVRAAALIIARIEQLDRDIAKQEQADVRS